MSVALVETSTFDASVIVPQNGIDLRNASSVAAPFQAVANRTKFLKDASDNIEDYLTDSAYETTLPKLDAMVGTTWAQLAGIAIADDVGVAQITLSSSAHFLHFLSLNSNYALSAVSARVIGFTGHGALPANMPEISLVSLTDGVPTTHVTQADTAANVGAYEVYHWIHASLTHDVSADAAYLIKFNGEYGANALAGLIVERLRLTFTAKSTAF